MAIETKQANPDSFSQEGILYIFHTLHTIANDSGNYVFIALHHPVFYARHHSKSQQLQLILELMSLMQGTIQSLIAICSKTHVFNAGHHPVVNLTRPQHLKGNLE